jgi:hypothetical protein
MTFTRRRCRHVRLEGFTAVTMKNVVFCDINIPFVPHGRTYYVSATQLSRLMLVIFEVFTAVTMKYAVFWDIKTEFVLHRRHITSPLHSSAGYAM